MAVRSRSGVVAGLGIASIVPALSLLIPALVQNGIAPAEAMRSMLDVFGFFTWLSLALLGPLGIAVAGRSAGVRTALGWLAVLVVAGPAYLAIWFLGAASLSGGLGNPF